MIIDFDKPNFSDNDGRDTGRNGMRRSIDFGALKAQSEPSTNPLVRTVNALRQRVLRLTKLLAAAAQTNVKLQAAYRQLVAKSNGQARAIQGLTLALNRAKAAAGQRPLPVPARPASTAVITSSTSGPGYPTAGTVPSADFDSSASEESYVNEAATANSATEDEDPGFEVDDTATDSDGEYHDDDSSPLDGFGEGEPEAF